MKRKINIVPIIIVSLLFLLLNWYVISGISVLTNLFYVKVIFWSVILLLSVSLLFAISRFGSRGMDTLFKFTTHAFLALFTAEIVFMVVLLLGDFYRLISGSVGYVRHIEGPFLPTRNVYWVEFGLLMFSLVILLFLYGIIKGKYAYRVINHTLYFKDLPESFDGFKITQISDIHSGSLNNAKALQKGIDLINAQQSDLFVFTGDLVNNKADEIVPWMKHFAQIKAPYGQFSVLGNHDYGDYVKWDNEMVKRGNLLTLKRYHAEMGYRLLLDEHVELFKNGEKIILAGVENWGVGFGERGDLRKALKTTSGSDFKVLLSHDPTHWEKEVKTFPNTVHLTLAGHTHGMQFGIEAFGIKWSPVQYRYAHWAGIISDNGRYLNINRGFGFLGFSGRIGIWPEITVIELKKG